MKLLVYLLLLLVPGTASAQQIEAKRFDYPYEVAVYDLPTASNGIDYRIYVRKPLREPAEGEKHSSIYFLDALANFTPAGAMTYNYEQFNYLPSAYYIGIGYQNEADGEWKAENRTRDYTPTAFTPPKGHFLEHSPKDWQGSGGAPAFFDVVEKEIIPFIEQNFANVDRTDRVLVGKSIGGLGATYALLERPNLFNRYLIISPAIWWDDWLKDRGDRWVMQSVNNADGNYKTPTRAYFAVGSAEERLDLVTDLYVMANGLRKRRHENLSLNVEVLDGEQHEGVFPSAFMRGIVGLYSQEENRKASSSQLTW